MSRRARAKSRGRSSLRYESVDRDDPNWPYGQSGQSKKTTKTLEPTRTFVREASPEFVPGPPVQESFRSESPNESMLNLSLDSELDDNNDGYGTNGAANNGIGGASDIVGLPNFFAPPTTTFQILTIPTAPRFPGRGPRPIRPAPSAFPRSGDVPRPVIRAARPPTGPVRNGGFCGARPSRGSPAPVQRVPVSSRSARSPAVASPPPSNSPRTRRGGGASLRGRGRGSLQKSNVEPIEISIDSDDDDDDLEIVCETRLTEKPVEKSPLDILAEQHSKAIAGSLPESASSSNHSNGPKSPIDRSKPATVRGPGIKDSRKRFPDWNSSDEASPAKSAKRDSPPPREKPGPASTKKNRPHARPPSPPPPPPAPVRPKLTDIQFQERRQLLLGIWPDATEDSLRRAIEATETSEEAEDWFFKYGESRKSDSTQSGTTKESKIKASPKASQSPVKKPAEDDDVVPLDSDGEDVDVPDDEAKRRKVLGKVKLPDVLDSRMKTNLFYMKAELLQEGKSYEEQTLKRALAKFNWKIDGAVRYLKTGWKKKPKISPMKPSFLEVSAKPADTSQTTNANEGPKSSTSENSSAENKTSNLLPSAGVARKDDNAAVTSNQSQSMINGFHAVSSPSSASRDSSGALSPSSSSATKSKSPAIGQPNKPLRTIVEPIAISDSDDEAGGSGSKARPSSYRGRGFGSGQMVNRGRGRGGAAGGGAGRDGASKAHTTPLWKQVLSSDDETSTNEDVKKKKQKKKTAKKWKREEDGEEEEWESDEEFGADYDSDEFDNVDFGSALYTNANEKEMILSFFNDTSPEELQIVPKCNKGKAAAILKARPFSNWDDLVAKFDQMMCKSLITEGKAVIKTRSTVVRLMIQCQRIAKTISREVKEMIASAQKAESEGKMSSIMRQPDNLNPDLQMKSFQLIGLNWLKLMHRNDKNGILADEMGLGKTIQTIAFLAHLLKTGCRGPHLIVVPSSTIDNWRKELDLWCPSLQVLPYTGTQDERAQIRDEIMDENALEKYNILISTYSQITSTTEDRILFKTQPFIYVVYDEAHQLKNMDTQKYQHLMRVKAQRRLLLTGTPLQNNLVELMSLLAFVMPSLFAGKTDHLIKIFKTVSVSDRSKEKAREQTAATQSGDKLKTFEQERIEHAKNIMKPFVLRRLKKDVLHHLPSKIEQKEFVPMLPEQRSVYDNLVKVFGKKVKSYNVKDMKKNSAFVKASSGMMMDLRKCSNHPLLIRNYYDDDTLAHMAHLIKTQDPNHARANESLILDDLKICNDIEVHNTCLKFPDILEPFLLQDEQICQSGKMAAMDKLFAELKPRGDRVLLFSQFTMLMDIIEVYLAHRGHSFLRLDGSTPISDRQALIDEYNNDSNIFVFLLSTKAGGHGINLTAANVVIIHDIDFNPYNDKQAADRCHRVGQSRPVTVYRLIGKDTIEENMLRMAEKKLRLEAEVVGDESSFAANTEANPVKSRKEREEEERAAASLLKEVLLNETEKS